MHMENSKITLCTDIEQSSNFIKSSILTHKKYYEKKFSAIYIIRNKMIQSLFIFILESKYYVKF